VTVLVQDFAVAVRQKTRRRRVAGSLLRAAREAAKLSQEDLAQELQVRIPTISDRENSDTVSWETWLALCQVLKISDPDEWKPGERVGYKPKP
jgi:transcriptional regulator with XRE-family HTH domain